MSMLCVSVAIWNFVQHRDISANMYVAAFFIIQGASYIPNEPRTQNWDRITLMCTILSVAICLFSAVGFFSGTQWIKPKSW